MVASTQQHTLAILDDYHDIAKPYFAKIPNLSITTFPTTLHPQHSPSDHAALIARLSPFTIISTMRERTPLPASILTQLPNLRLLLTTGTRNLSIPEATVASLSITYAGTVPPPKPTHAPVVPTTKAASVGYSNTNEHTWALLLALAKNVPQDDYNVKARASGGWETALVTGLAGKTIGLLGLGRLGAQAAVTAALAFGMRVVAWSENLTQAKADAVAERAGLDKGAFRVTATKRELFEVSDIVSVHLVLSERSVGVVGEEELWAMKEDALLVNTSRGPLVDEKALLAVLKKGAIAGAALDVFDVEPLPDDSEWRSTEWGKNGTSRVVLSPHMGYAETRTMHSWYEQQAVNVERWLNGDEVLNKILPQQ
ncbi:uncharacterized protein HMPREF1541_00630 [Cyphellophora europaea CBS 101466]|uniref:D-isomer specific 2-hydroxyacid dehydrogenase NAD-binding domain-containing protein n=1 Tax=Cyphellophora europaea (strain CBS 101466) TaxID=1220924 RepID=W2SCK9_CYPE1|nr:uncharacterized protein HMPREF1541_00630 [Cyphellophora europaea CBS 101466]ETN46446.1 hypothetical protein HMPREF1541_00630 [Cyphellophora europaea CBS 101466]